MTKKIKELKMSKSIKEIKQMRSEKLMSKIKSVSEIELDNIYKSIVKNVGKHEKKNYNDFEVIIVDEYEPLTGIKKKSKRVERSHFETFKDLVLLED
jgi:hypothetical protein